MKNKIAMNSRYHLLSQMHITIISGKKDNRDKVRASDTSTKKYCDAPLMMIIKTRLMKKWLLYFKKYDLVSAFSGGVNK